MGIVTAVLGAAAASFLPSVIAGTAITSAMITGFLVRAAIGVALYALSPKPKQPQNRGYTVNSRGSALDHQIIYGRAKVGAVVVFDGTTGNNNKFLHRVLAFAGHRVESFDEIYINDAKVTNLESDGNVKQVELPDGTLSNRYDGFIRIKKHKGFDGQSADSSLVSEVSGWTNNHRLRGIAYLYCRFKFDSDKFPNGVPIITATIKGKRVYDPRTGSISWSDNPALCLRDYLTQGYGLNESPSNIDGDLVRSAADVCDETNTLSGNTRFTCNGAFTTAQAPYDTINSISTSMGGLVWYSQGKWRMKPAHWVAPTITFDEDDLRSSVSVKTRHSRRDNFNTIRGTFRGEESNWQVTDYPEVTNSAFLSADNGQESVINLDLPFTDSSEEARRIARIALERNRQQLTVSASFGLRAFKVQVGDVVRLNLDRFGWSYKEFEVVSWTFGLTDDLDLQVQMSLREISESVFDEVDDGQVYERDNTILGDSLETQIPFLNEASVSAFVNNDGTTIPQIKFSWGVLDESAVDYYIFQWKLTTESTYNSQTIDGNEYVLSPAVSGVSYDYRVAAVNHLGVKSQFVTSPSPVSTGDDGTTPNAPTNLSASGGYESITVTWDEPSQNTDGSDLKDLFQYKIYRGTSNNPTSFVGRISGEAFTDSGLDDNQTYYYRIKALDFTGNESAYSANVSATTNPQILDGADGTSVLVVYAANASGTNQSLNANGREYVQYVEYTGTVPTLPVSGTFVKFVGPGGQSIYPIYADDAAGNGQSFSPTGKTHVTFYESTTTPNLPVSGQTFVPYVGQDGDVGERGPGRWHIGVSSLPTTSSGAHTDFTNAIGDPVDSDQAWFYTGSQSSPTGQSVWIYDEGSGPVPSESWQEQTEVIDGNLLVTDTVTADKIDVTDLSAISADLGSIEVDTANIKNLAVGTAKIQDGAVTNDFSFFAASSKMLDDTGFEPETRIANLTFSCDGNSVNVWAIFQMENNPYTEVRLYLNDNQIRYWPLASSSNGILGGTAEIHGSLMTTINPGQGNHQLDLKVTNFRTDGQAVYARRRAMASTENKK